MQYRVTSPILRNGEKIQVGELIDLNDADAKQLLQSGCIQEEKPPYFASALKIEIDLGSE